MPPAEDSLAQAPPTEQPPGLLALLHALEDLSSRMRQAAEAGDWAAVAAMQGTCSALIERLRPMSEHSPLTAAEQDEKQRVMLALLRDDAQMRQWAATLPAEPPVPRVPATPSWLH
jgi:hypothetical protein